MIVGTSRAVRVFAYPAPVDLRKGYDGLYGIVNQGLNRDPLSGDLFLSAVADGAAAKCWCGTAPDSAFSRSGLSVDAPCANLT